MKPVTAAMTLLLGVAILFGACKKADDLKNALTGSGDLNAGQCTISFNTDKDFNGTTSIDIPPGLTTTAVKSSNVNRDQLSLIATTVNVSSMKTTTAQFVISVPKGATTSGGSLTIPFQGNGVNSAAITVANTSTGQSTPAYTSESGTVTITKLSDSEIEGTFSCHAVNESENTSINLSNGKFAGKFK